MTGHRVGLRRKMNMENQRKLGKHLVKRTIKEISTVPSTPLTKPEMIHTPLIKFFFFFFVSLPSFFVQLPQYL